MTARAALQALLILASLSDALELAPLNRAVLQMPSHAYRNRLDPGDPHAQLGAPDSPAEALTLAACIHEHLSRLLALEQPRITVRVASILLGMGPTPATLMQAARLLYDLSKSPEHDALFHEVALLPRMLQCVTRVVRTRSSAPQAALSLDAALLLLGAMKNATACVAVRFALAQSGGVDAMLRTLRICADEDAGADCSPACVAIAVQALGTLRNLAASAELCPELLDSGIVGAMRGVVPAAACSEEVAFGVARLLAKLSLSERAVDVFLADRDALCGFVHAASAHAGSLATALRFAFALANFAADSRQNAATVGAVRA